LFLDDKWKADVGSIVRQAGWKGNLDDLRHAAAVATVSEIQLPVGTRMPFMSSRKDGQPVALIDVLWAGTEPISAYAFDFTSNQRRYRCITPKPCSNFYLVDLGAAFPVLTMECSAPAEVTIGRRFDVCLTVTNGGTAAQPPTTLRLQIPSEAKLIDAANAVTNTEGRWFWTIPPLEPGAARQFCASVLPLEPAMVNFTAALEGTTGPLPTSRCETQVRGITAILLETADLEDPIEVGKQAVYVIKVTNQGSAPGTNLKVVCRLPDSEEFISSTGATPAHGEDRAVIMDSLAELAPKAQASWQVTVKALKPDDARFKVFVSTDQFQEPIRKDEATHLY
jgi:uncharacterized repeat protein (TIGR01451 family)